MDLANFWEDFENEKVRVECCSEEEAKDFMQEAKKRGFYWFSRIERTYYNPKIGKVHYYSNLWKWLTYDIIIGSTKKSIITINWKDYKKETKKKIEKRIEKKQEYIGENKTVETMEVVGNFNGEYRYLNTKRSSSRKATVKYFRNGDTLTCVYKSLGIKGVGIAKKHPEDKFNVITGMSIAEIRAMEDFYKNCEEKYINEIK